MLRRALAMVRIIRTHRSRPVSRARADFRKKPSSEPAETSIHLVTVDIRAPMTVCRSLHRRSSTRQAPTAPSLLMTSPPPLRPGRIFARSSAIRSDSARTVTHHHGACASTSSNSVSRRHLVPGTPRPRSAVGTLRAVLSRQNASISLGLQPVGGKRCDEQREAAIDQVRTNTRRLRGVLTDQADDIANATITHPHDDLSPHDLLITEPRPRSLRWGHAGREFVPTGRRNLSRDSFASLDHSASHPRRKSPT